MGPLSRRASRRTSLSPAQALYRAARNFLGDFRDVLCRDGIGTWYRRCRHYLDDDGNGSEALHGARAEYVFLYRHIAAARDEHRGWSHRRAHFTRARFLYHRGHVWHRRDYGGMAGAAVGAVYGTVKKLPSQLVKCRMSVVRCLM